MITKIILKLTAKPTAPNPKIATEEPFLGFATLKIAPNPEIVKVVSFMWSLDINFIFNTEILEITQCNRKQPVEMPQLRMHTLSRGANGLIFATQPEWITVYSLKVEVPRKWFIGSPLIENLDFPSASMTPLNGFVLKRSHMLLSSDLQC